MEATDLILEFTRAYLAIFYTFVAGFYALRIMTRTRRGEEVIFPGECYSASWWNHLLFRVFRATIWLVCVARWVFPSVDDYLGMIASLNIGPVVLIGDILLTSGFVLAIAGHLSLGRGWRSGVDPRGPAGLRTEGLYRYSRNPMFVGVAIAQFGFFLALPSVFSLVCLIVGVYALQRQIKVEEAHLSEKFGDGYQQYRSRVGRWI